MNTSSYILYVTCTLTTLYRLNFANMKQKTCTGSLRIYNIGCKQTFVHSKKRERRELNSKYMCEFEYNKYDEEYQLPYVRIHKTGLTRG